MGVTLQVPVKVAESKDTSDAVLEVELDEFQAARKDPKVKHFLEDAADYGAKLEAEGRTDL